jgi:SpoVK/Ycf46/Vps4 family AAA+-type ATPase
MAVPAGGSAADPFKAVFVVAATNVLSRIEPALLSAARLGAVLLIPPPSKVARRSVAACLLAGPMGGFYGPGVTAEAVAELTEPLKTGFKQGTGADVAALLRAAFGAAVRDFEEAQLLAATLFSVDTARREWATRERQRQQSALEAFYLTHDPAKTTRDVAAILTKRAGDAGLPLPAMQYEVLSDRLAAKYRATPPGLPPSTGEEVEAAAVQPMVTLLHLERAVASMWH